MNTQLLALVSGGNRGLGLGCCAALADKGYRVLLGSRDLEAGHSAAKSLASDQVEAVKLDVSSASDIAALADYIGQTYARLDVLINNAGIMIDTEAGASPSILDADAAVLRKTLEVNTIAPIMLINALMPSMQKTSQVRIINISSGMGQLGDMGGQYPAYRISKTALNAVTRIFAAELDAGKISINSVCPGWVRTDMGGKNAELSVEQGIDTAIWLATSADAQGSGGFYRNREAIDW